MSIKYIGFYVGGSETGSVPSGTSFEVRVGYSAPADVGSSYKVCLYIDGSELGCHSVSGDGYTSFYPGPMDPGVYTVRATLVRVNPITGEGYTVAELSKQLVVSSDRAGAPPGARPPATVMGIEFSQFGRQATRLVAGVEAEARVWISVTSGGRYYVCAEVDGEALKCYGPEEYGAGRYGKTFVFTPRHSGVTVFRATIYNEAYAVVDTKDVSVETVLPYRIVGVSLTAPTRVYVGEPARAEARVTLDDIEVDMPRGLTLRLMSDSDEVHRDEVDVTRGQTLVSRVYELEFPATGVYELRLCAKSPIEELCSAPIRVEVVERPAGQPPAKPGAPRGGETPGRPSTGRVIGRPTHREVLVRWGTVGVLLVSAAAVALALGALVSRR